MTADPPNSSNKRKANDPQLLLISDDEEDPSPINSLHKKHGEKDKDFNNTTVPTSPTHQQEDRKLSISSAKLALDEFNKNNFFAEILTVHLSEPAVTCVSLEGKTRDGCDYCPSFIIHPVDGYEAGCPKCSPHSPLSISDHAEDPLIGPNLETELSETDIDSDSELGSAIGRGSPPPSPVWQYHEWRGQSIRFGNLALDTYNKENNTKFELIVDDTMVCDLFVCSRTFVHFIFYAVEGSSVQQFFTEIHLDDSSNKLVALCKMLEEGKTMMGCRFCTSFIHPVEGFQEGCSKYGPKRDSDFVQKEKDTEESPLMD